MIKSEDILEVRDFKSARELFKQGRLYYRKGKHTKDVDYKEEDLGRIISIANDTDILALERAVRRELQVDMEIRDTGNQPEFVMARILLSFLTQDHIERDNLAILINRSWWMINDYTRRGNALFKVDKAFIKHAENVASDVYNPFGF